MKPCSSTVPSTTTIASTLASSFFVATASHRPRPRTTARPPSKTKNHRAATVATASHRPRPTASHLQDQEPPYATETAAAIRTRRPHRAAASGSSSAPSGARLVAPGRRAGWARHTPRPRWARSGHWRGRRRASRASGGEGSQASGSGTPWWCCSSGPSPWL